MAVTTESAAKLLDISIPLDVHVLDGLVAAFYGAGTSEERSAAENILKKLQEHPEAWTRVDSILERSQSQQSKFFALQILEEVIKFRWGALPDDQRIGIRNYVSNLVIKMSTDEVLFRQEKIFLNKLNVILVQILKQDWPHKWTTFIPDIVMASKKNETLCENSMAVLKLLSEEVFDFSAGELTQAKTKELKNSLNQEFRLIHELCQFVLTVSQRPDLTRSTLATLHAYLSWVPVGYIFESNVVEMLLRLFPQPPFRNIALQCLTEVASLEEFNQQFSALYIFFMQQLHTVLPPQTDIPSAYDHGTDDDQAFVQNLALFFTTFLKLHYVPLEASEEGRQALLLGLDYLLKISFVNDDEVFKICLDYWNFFVPEVYSSVQTGTESTLAFMSPGMVSGRKQLYQLVLSRLRLLMICKMAKPEEVIVVEDENGNIVRETMKDTDVLARYKTMHETLVYLSHLDHEDTENQMLEKLRLQLNGKEWSWQALNTLCWAIGSISGSMAEEQENRFLVTVIRDLLNLCEITRGKDNKAVIASNIMYVVGQYPRFLCNHWKFLKTVVNKLFEFMHETHPGVQDMACETFLKICRKCKRKFVSLQAGEVEPFVCELLQGLTAIIQDLETHQIHMFFEAVGLMIAAETDAKRREYYLEQLMAPPNSTWRNILSQAAASPDMLKEQDIIRNVQNILQTNTSVCSSVGPPFLTQLSGIYLDMLKLYRMYSELISVVTTTGGQHAARTSQVKLMRGVKRSALRLLETFVERCEDTTLIAEQFVPAMLDPILGDYARGVPDARDPEVLSLFAVIINKLKDKMEPQVPRIFEAVFECTLQMITKNFEDYPEHRLQFFALLRAITNHCFTTLFAMSPGQLRMVIDSIVWAFRHTERNVADTGLNLLLELLEMFSRSDVATQFYQTYYLQLMQEVFAVMTDTFHKPGFKMHAKILHHLFGIVGTSIIKAPLWDVSTLPATAFPSNAVFVHSHVSKLLSISFPNMQPTQVEVCVSGMLELKDASAFKQHLRDFLVQSKSFVDKDNQELFAEEAAARQAAERQRLAQIPGMLHPHEAMQEEVMGD
eukprot:jgi/Botrbrau1/1436/Bobra.0063s0127.1